MCALSNCHSLKQPVYGLGVRCAGHGTGVIKKVVREHLKTCRYAEAYGPADFDQVRSRATPATIEHLHSCNWPYMYVLQLARCMRLDTSYN